MTHDEIIAECERRRRKAMEECARVLEEDMDRWYAEETARNRAKYAPDAPLVVTALRGGS